ncbi:MAG: hypothetical protein ACJ8C4_20520 [Gemmataceae bacterium]
MHRQSRRGFLADVGRGMLVASLGSVVAQDLGLASASAVEGADALTFGPLEPLVGLMQDTPAAQLLPILVGKLKSGNDLRTLVCAGALANARSFGGQDYTGYHALMALVPALQMSQELPEAERALPVLKVLYRNTNRIQEQGGRKKEVLHELIAAEHATEKPVPESIRDGARKADFVAAEQSLARSLASGTPNEAFNHLQFAIQDEVDVHRVVLSWRAWALLDLTGPEHAQTLLRQSVRFCVNAEKLLQDHNMRPSGIRTTLPKLLDQHRFVGRNLGDRQPVDDWVEKLAETICNSNRDAAADAVAAALAEGFAPEAIGEAISLAANQLVLRDPGRTKDEDGKPKGSVHGASVGVHASDSANAWRNIARVSNQRNTAASLIVGAYHTAGQTNGLNNESFPATESLESIKENDAVGLLRATEAAIKDKDQVRACALVHRYGQMRFEPRPVFDLLLRYAVSEDGALHAEKYYRTVTEEFASTGPAFRWRHLAALARVTASEYGWPAAGVAEARRLLNV